MGHTIIIYTVAGRGHATPKFSAHYTSYTCTEWHNTCIHNVHDICILSLVMYIYIYTVPRHLLGWVLQPPAPNISTQAHSFLNQNIQYENELGTFRLGTLFCVCTWSSTNYRQFYQNENVNRSYTSLSTVKDLRRPDRHTPLKVLVSKTFKFVDQLWEMYVTKNKVDLRYVCMEMVLFSLSTNNM